MLVVFGGAVVVAEARHAAADRPALEVGGVVGGVGGGAVHVCRGSTRRRLLSPPTAGAAAATSHKGAVPARGATEAVAAVGYPRRWAAAVAAGGASAAEDEHAAVDGQVLSCVGAGGAGGEGEGGLLIAQSASVGTR